MASTEAGALSPAEAIPAPRVTEADILAMLRARYSLRYGNGFRYAVASHVRNAAGFNASRTLDAVVMDTWPSSGLVLHGFEIKTSRADWRRELAQPWKAEPFTRYLDFFWVVAPSGVVHEDERPAGWGLLEVRGTRLVQAVRATRLTPEPIDRSFLAALFRATCRAARELTG